VKWLINREWLDYDESNDIMTCKIWQRWWWWWLLWRLTWWSWKLLAYMNMYKRIKYIFEYQWNFYIKLFNYFILFICFIKQFVGSIW
jgi:hypothetical protein